MSERSTSELRPAPLFDYEQGFLYIYIYMHHYIVRIAHSPRPMLTSRGALAGMRNSSVGFIVSLSVIKCVLFLATGPDGAVVKSSANWLVGTEFASRYGLQHRAGFIKAQWVGIWPTPSSLSLISNRVTTNY